MRWKLTFVDTAKCTHPDMRNVAIQHDYSDDYRPRALTRILSRCTECGAEGIRNVSGHWEGADFDDLTLPIRVIDTRGEK